MYKMYMVISWLALLVYVSSFPDQLPSTETLLEFEGYIGRIMKCRNIPALAVSLVKGDSFVWSRGFGYEDIENNVPATHRTPFCIGSLTKAFTATLLGQLLSEQTEFNWDTPLLQILGKTFRLTDDMRTKNANLRDILAHKMGVPAYFNAFVAGWPHDVTRDELVRRLRFMEPTDPFRTSFIYNNYMYSLAGSVAETLANDTWENLVKEKIFNFLKMNSSTFIKNTQETDSLAKPYITVDGKLVNISKELVTIVNPAGPAGSIISTAEDMVHWIKFHLSTSTTQTLSRELRAIAEIYADQMPVRSFPSDKTKPRYPVNDVNIAYAFGWMNANYRGYRKIWHSGGMVSFTSALWLFPDVNAGLFFAISGPLDKNKRLFTQELTYYAADILLGEQPWLNMSTACKFPLPFAQKKAYDRATSRKKVAVLEPTRPLTDYTGTYGHLAFGNITVTVNTDNPQELFLNYGRFAKMNLKLIEQPDIFSGKYVGPLWYATDSDDGEPPLTIRFRSSEESTGLSILEYPVTNGKATVFIRGLRLDNTSALQRTGNHSPGSNTYYLSLLPLFLVVRTLV